MNTLKLLQKEVARQTGLDITKETRERPYVYARFVYYKLCKDLTTLGYTHIGKSIGKNHATIINGIKIFDNVISTQEPYFMAIYYDIKTKFSTDGKISEFNDPVGYWKSRYEEVKDKYYDFGEDYKRMMTLNLFMKGLLKQRGYQYKFMEEDMKEFEAI